MSGPKPNFLQELHKTFHRKANNVAFVINDEKFSYKSLETKVHLITNLIKSRIRSERIGIFTDNSIETYASILACWYTGKSFVPFDATAPKERNLNIIKQASIEYFLGPDDIHTKQYAAHIKLTSTSIEYKSNDIPTQYEYNMDIQGEAYVLFTSGSTGKPKGVPISMSNLQSFLDSFRTTEFQVSESDRCLQMFELTFDVSISSFLPALLAGAEVYTAGRSGNKYVEVLRLISEYQLTSIQIVPSIIRLGRSLIKRVDLSSVNQCIFTGEATDINTFLFISSAHPQIEYFNFYGPTECTIYCTYCQLNVSSPNYAHGIMSIGKPMLGILATTAEGQELNSNGELYLQGKQLTSGYLDKTMNDDAFIQTPSGTFYKTGDIVELQPDGNLYYIGRKDSQVHRQGYRIELGEISHLISARFKINSWPIHVISQEGLDLIIIVMEERDQAQFRDPVSDLNDLLPSYMRPNSILFLRELPLTASGKVDRNQLKELILSL